MAVKRRKKTAHPSDELPDEVLLGDLEPDWALDDYDEGAFDDVDASIEPKATPRKPRKKRAPSKKKVHVPLSAPPFQILLFHPTERKYKWIDKWGGKKAPGPADLREKYGAGRYEVRDDLKNSERWDIGPSPFEAPPAQAAPPEPPPEIEADHESPPPPRIYTHELPPWMQPPPPSGYPPAWGSASPTATRAGAPSPYPPPHHHQPPPPPQAPAPPTSSGPDAQTLGTIYRLDAAIQQIAADQRRIQDELRSVTYELQQVPTRVAERVSSAIDQASDPFDQMSKVWDMSRMMADGYAPGEKEESGGFAGLAEGLLAAMASKMGGPPPGLEGPQPPQLQPPQTGHAPPPNGGAPPPSGPGEPELPGMTPEIRQELLAHAASRGLRYGDAITMARRNGWSAQELLHLARNPPPNAPPPGTPTPAAQ